MDNISNELVTLNEPILLPVEENLVIDNGKKTKCIMYETCGKNKRRCRRNIFNGEYCKKHYENMIEDMKEENEDEFKKCECDEALIYAKCLYNMHLVYCSTIEKLYQGDELIKLNGFCNKIKNNKDDYIDVYKQLYKQNKKEFKRLIKPEDMLKYLVERDMLDML